MSEDSQDMQVCSLDDIPVGSARGFVVGSNNILIVRLSLQHVAAYLNRCPHLGTPLNWHDHEFMDNDSSLIRCATHGALFEPDSGLCIMGPCRGESLWQLSCHAFGEGIFINLSELPGAPAQT